MKIRRVLFSISLCIVLITLNIIPVSAEEGSSEVLDVRDFTYECYYGDDNENNEKLPLTVTDGTYGSDGIWMRNYSCNSNASVKTLIVTDLTDLIAEHEYNLEFYYATDYINTTVLGIELRYYTSTGEWIKTQTLAQFTSHKVGNQLYSGNFKPDVSGINQSYNIKLCILFLTPNTSTCSWRISHDIKLTDKDDNSDWFAKIYYALLEHDDNVDAAVSQLENKLSSQLITLDSNVDSYIDTLDSHIKVYIENLGSDLLAAISSLDGNLARYIKSFQDTLIANDNSLFDALKDFLHNEMNPGVYDDPGTDDFQDNKDEWDKIEGDLPSFDSSDMHEVDISDYSGGFGVVRYLFDRFLDASGLTTLISFSLMFGLGVFLIGRKVGG